MIGYEINRCKKCHEPILRVISKRKGLKFLEGYIPKDDLCLSCNYTESVKMYLRLKKDLTKKHLIMLPNLLVFDPSGNDPEEYAYGLHFQEIVKNAVKSII